MLHDITKDKACVGIVEKSIEILRAHEKEIKEMMLKDFSIKEETLDELLGAGTTKGSEMGAEPHGQLFVNPNSYLGFKEENYAYAIAIQHIKKIVAMGEGTPYVIPPQAPEYVKCMVKLEGKFLAVIGLVEACDRLTVQSCDNQKDNIFWR